RKSLSQKRVTGHVAGKARSAARLGIEALETRELMAASLTASLSGGLLRIEGTEGADSINVRKINDQISVEGIDILFGGVRTPSVSASQVSRLEVFSLGGDDVIGITADNLTGPNVTQANIYGGNDRDTLTVLGAMAASLYFDGSYGTDRLVIDD